MNDHRFEYANLANLTFIEELYSKYLKDHLSVDETWRHFFEGMAFGARLPRREERREERDELSPESSDFKLFRLIEAYRMYGHRAARFNPIDRNPRSSEEVPELQLKSLGFTESELSRQFSTRGLLKEERAPLSAIVERLKAIYCNQIGFEYMGMQMPEIESYIQNQVEGDFPFPMTHEEKVTLLHRLNTSEIFESFIHMKYPGQKRFSLEGGETLIPILHEMIVRGAEEEVQSVVLGMAHRGRLNVLANILNKPYRLIFREFEKTYVADSFGGTGDVNYHLGFESHMQTPSGKEVHLYIAANPSHLESVDPVLEGEVRARQEMAKGERRGTIPILIHGDAAIAGQGVVYETIQFCKLSGYETGGTIHIVINNQIGFTAIPKESRSTRYSTDLAKAFGAPIFHINAEDPESCIAISRLAVQIRQKFSCDVFIDLNCYRKYGHNETDEPGFTQPLIYQKIRERKNIRDLYRDSLIKEGNLSDEEAKAIEDEFKEKLEKALEETKESIAEKKEVVLPEEKNPSPLLSPVETGVSSDHLKELAQKFCTFPEHFHVHAKVKRIFDSRLQMMEEGEVTPLLDWGMAEYLAYATLLSEKIHVRLSGQDSGRGTFSHRHAIVIDQSSEERYIPLNHLSSDQASFDVYNSPLSEYAVMGFEYGYSLVFEKSLVIWEAQYGDFANGAQIPIDQYVISAQQKWGDQSSLTLLLPHGYEGQGPEHTSARIERFLQAAVNDSISVVIPTTAAQFYHVLRRQAIREMKRPLILVSPKSLLRFPPSYSSIKAIGENTFFEEVIDDPNPPEQITHLVFCSGKVFYDLVKERENRKILDSAFVRIEQLYPFHEDKVKRLIDKYRGFSKCYWVQEEHENMGGWEFIRPRLQKLLPEKMELGYVGRIRSAVPAAGSKALHQFELAKFLNEAFWRK